MDNKKVLLIISLIIAIVIFPTLSIYAKTKAKVSSVKNKTQQVVKLKKLNNAEIIKKVKPAVVYIETDSGSGSGMIIDSSGYVLTNAHVVSGVNQATIMISDKREFSGVVVGRDEKSDLAILKMSGQFHYIDLGDSDKVKQGDKIFTFGYPFGINDDVSFKDGTISRKLDDNKYFEISAEIHPGNSGGPLVNEYGQVIGINTALYGQQIQGVIVGESIKIAIPINIVKNEIPKLKNGLSIINDVPKKTITCNNKEWNDCQPGYKFVCPSQGDAFCDVILSDEQTSTSTSNKGFTMNYIQNSLYKVQYLLQSYSSEQNDVNYDLGLLSGYSDSPGTICYRIVSIRNDLIVKMTNLLSQEVTVLNNRIDYLNNQRLSYFLSYDFSYDRNLSVKEDGYVDQYNKDKISYGDAIRKCNYMLSIYLH